MKGVCVAASLMLEPDIHALLDRAIAAAQHAYIPYSHFAVGAAIRATDGTVYTGCNIENASFPVTICGERTALFKAVSEGRRSFDVVVIVSPVGAAPCGMCRQALNEFAPHLRVVLADLEGHVKMDTRLDILLPGSFGPDDLPH